MKKMIKLSLVAAVAVAGLTTSATAGSLEDAIKGTTVSGKAMIGYNYADTNVQNNLGVTKTANAANDSTSNQTEYDFDITMNTKVNDTITFTSGIQADHTVDNRDETTNTNGSQAITLTKCGCSTCPPCDDPADAAAKKEAKHVTKVVSEAMAKFVAKHEEL